jgi:hypothetical protein
VEVLQGLDFLPRQLFLGAVLGAAHDAGEARAELVSEIEEARITVLPSACQLAPGREGTPEELAVYPDAILESAGVRALIEAKRPKSSSFQTEQLTREYVLALRDPSPRTPLLMLILGSPPPVRVKGHGEMPIREAILSELESVIARTEGLKVTLDEAADRIDDVVSWTTWREIADVVGAQQAALGEDDPSVHAALTRLAGSVIDAIERHGG